MPQRRTNGPCPISPIRPRRARTPAIDPALFDHPRRRLLAPRLDSSSWLLSGEEALAQLQISEDLRSVKAREN